LRVPELEVQLGMEVYASKAQGIGGKIRKRIEDFVVEEILRNGSCASISEVETPPKRRLTGKGKHTVCLLIKRNWDNLLLVKRIARLLGVSPRRVHIAGIKDTRAVTAQHVSIRDLPPKRIFKLSLKDAVLYPLCYSKTKISVNQLYGNRFTITIQDVPCESFEITKRIQKVWQELSVLGGMPNFFGHQRFGTVRPITHLVGKALTQGKLEEAAMIFLAQPSLFEHPKARRAREQLQKNGDFSEALRNFPRHLKFEVLMLRHLAQKPNDFIGAFRKLPLRLRRLFVQAYQSYLFNRFLSERIRRGISLRDPQIGDYLVFLDEHGLPVRHGLIADFENLEEVQEAVKKGKMRVAIPLVGYRQPPSRGIQGEIERRILREEKVDPEDFNVASMSEVGAPGGLRTALAPIINFEFDEPSSDEENPLKGKVRCRFTLLRGCYATVFLREIMKPQNVLEAGF